MKIVVSNYWFLLANIFDCTCSFNMKISFTAFLNNAIDMIDKISSSFHIYRYTCNPIIWNKSFSVV